VDDRRQPLGLAAGALEDFGEAARHDIEIEALVLHRILGRPDERADGGAGREREIVEGDGVVLGHAAGLSRYVFAPCYGVGGEKERGDPSSSVDVKCRRRKIWPTHDYVVKSGC